MTSLQPVVVDIEMEVSAEHLLRGVDVGGVIQALNRGALFGAQYIQGLWIRVAQGMKVHDKGDYIRGISADARLDVEHNAIMGDTWEVVVAITNTCPHASIVEYGHPAFSLPQAINWGSGTGRIKRNEKGEPYLHIPFRHAAFADADKREEQGMTQGTLRRMMPEHIYAQARNLSRVIKQNAGLQYGVHGYRAADKYHWPKQRHRRRLNRGHTSPSIQLGANQRQDPGAHSPGRHNVGFEEHRGARMVGRDRNGGALVNPAWMRSRFHGMFKSGPKKHTQYMTIRTITPHSAGWNIPAQHGRYIMDKVATSLRSDGRLQEVMLMGVHEALGEAQP